MIPTELHGVQKDTVEENLPGSDVEMRRIKEDKKG